MLWCCSPCVINKDDARFYKLGDDFTAVSFFFKDCHQVRGNGEERDDNNRKKYKDNNNQY